MFLANIILYFTNKQLFFKAYIMIKYLNIKININITCYFINSFINSNF